MSNDQFPQMLYLAGGPEEIHGGRFTTLIVANAEQLETALDEGWAERTDTALDLVARPAAKPADPIASSTAEPTRAELEQKAAELGIEFSPLIGNAKLVERITAKLAELSAI